MKKVKFDIQGMTCSSCQAHVERAVKKLSGTKKVEVNLLSNNMKVEYDEKELNNEDIIKAVVDAGYGAKVFERKSGEEKNDSASTEELKSMKKRLITSICLLIPLMYIAMNHMFYMWFKIPVPSFIKSLFHGTKNALNFAVAQFILLIPIMFVNRNYFIIRI